MPGFAWMCSTAAGVSCLRLLALQPPPRSLLRLWSTSSAGPTGRHREGCQARDRASAGPADARPELLHPESGREEGVATKEGESV